MSRQDWLTIWAWGPFFLLTLILFAVTWGLARTGLSPIVTIFTGREMLFDD